MIALALTTLVVGFALGAMAMNVKPRRKPSIDIKVARDEIEEMIAG